MMKSGNRKFRFAASVLIGSTVGNILRTIRGHRIDVRYMPKFVLTFLIAGLLEAFNLFERVAFKRKIASLGPGEPPVFIIGFWRSGTTILHSLLCQDRLAAYVTTFHAVFPNLVLTQGRLIKPILSIFLPGERPFDGYAMDMDFPQEEDFAMMSLQARSIYQMFYFPKDFDRLYHKELYFEEYTEKDRGRWERHYLELVGKARLNTGGERYISKNPCNIFRIEKLISLFPDARFIFIYRNPYPVVESLYRFVNEVLPGAELQHREGGIPRKSIAGLYKDAMHEYFRVHNQISPGNLIEIRYEEFKKDSMGIIQMIYDRFNMPGINGALPKMEVYIKRNPPDVRRLYEIPEETYRLVNEYAGTILNRLGYPLVSGAKAR